MVEIHLSDRLGHVSSKKLGFSWLHFCLGPFYCFYKLHIILGLLEAIFCYYMLPIPGMDLLVKGLNSFLGSTLQASSDVQANVERYLMVFRTNNNWIISIVLLVLIHIAVSFFVEGYFLRRQMKKKQLRPVEEKDARLLIKYHVTSTNVALAESFDLRQSNSYKSAEESWYENNQMRLKGERATRFMTRSTILFASDKTGYGKRKPGTQTIEIESWNDNSFGGYDEEKIKKEVKDDEFSNFTDYSQFVQEEPAEQKTLSTEPIHFDSGKTVEFTKPTALDEEIQFTKTDVDN